MGFGAQLSENSKDNKSLLKQIHPDDLVKFGLIPEFIGRLPIHVALNSLSKEDLMKIITEPKNSIIKQYAASLKIDDVNLIFLPEAIEAIAEKSIAQKTGARGLRSIVENIMIEVMYDIPSKKSIKEVTVTREAVENMRLSSPDETKELPA
jgi:ATP-dependent Clp protease ATP-binding subunit ClpX